VLVTPDKDVFHGIFKNDLRSHIGYLHNQNNYLYIGEFDRGKIARYGLMKKYSPRTFYAGGMKLNKKNGFGAEKTQEGWIVGDYKEDALNGFCELYSSDKSCLF
jgi:hypothetical protein